MERRADSRPRRPWVSHGIQTGALIGGIIGAAVVLLDRTDMVLFASLRHILAFFPLNGAVTGTVLGMLVGGSIGRLVEVNSAQRSRVEAIEYPEVEAVKHDVPACGSKNSERTMTEVADPVTLQIHEERLDITKERVQTAEVTIHTEIVTENQTVMIPVTREELVVEKTVVHNGTTNHDNESKETIRIPICEEQIEVTKHPVELAEVDVYHHQYEELQPVEATVKKERVYLEMTGNLEVTNEETGKSL